MHPYKSQPERAFWSRSVSRGFDPLALVGDDGPFLRDGDRIASAGSCFASNLIPYIEDAGFPYIRTEAPHVLMAGDKDNLGYSLFSAAYGNIYTSRHLKQLWERATGAFEPSESVWEHEGELIDPFRPGMRYLARSVIEFDALQRQHLDAVIEAFSSATVLVFTLGLTEAWISRVDGATYPACPGTIRGTFDPLNYEFKNFSVAEIVDDLGAFISGVRRFNKDLRLLFSVSPVPLVATATRDHVLSASIYSKSVLRVAAHEVCNSFPDVRYFPAFELVTGPQAPESYFESDKRNVSTSAVETVMAVLLGKRVVSSEVDVAPDRADAVGGYPADARGNLLGDIVDRECDELMADR